MKAIALGGTALFLALLFGAFALISFVVIAAGGALSASAAVTVSSPSEEALEDIPPLLIRLFVEEAQRCPGLPWTVLAGISKVESDHGRFGGSSLGPDGVIRPSIIGIPLNGSDGIARIVDSDGGRWDGDTVWDRAVGPFQFIPGSWRLFGGDGDNDGIADPNNVFDAVPAVRRHLCPDGQIVDIEAAIFDYNRSASYVEAVLDWARRYTGPLTTAAVPVAGYSLPVPAALVNETSLGRPHHDYAAIDLGVPVGTPLFAMVAGTVTTASIGWHVPAGSEPVRHNSRDRRRRRCQLHLLPPLSTGGRPRSSRRRWNSDRTLRRPARRPRSRELNWPAPPPQHPLRRSHHLPAAAAARDLPLVTDQPEPSHRLSAASKADQPPTGTGGSTRSNPIDQANPRRDTMSTKPAQARTRPARRPRRSRANDLRLDQWADMLGIGSKAVLTTRETASVLRVSEKSVREGIKEGSIPCIRLGRRLLVPCAYALCRRSFGGRVPTSCTNRENGNWSRPQARKEVGVRPTTSSIQRPATASTAGRADSPPGRKLDAPSVKPSRRPSKGRSSNRRR